MADLRGRRHDDGHQQHPCRQFGQPWGGGIYTFALTLKNSIVANNQASAQGANCILEAPITSGGHNLVDDNTCALSGVGDMDNIAAGLDPGGLSDNGGTTQTIALAIGNSPALNAVPVAPTNDCTLADNVTRIVTDAPVVFQARGCGVRHRGVRGVRGR